MLSSLNAVISTNESTQIITGHVIYNPVYTYKFQLKTTLIVIGLTYFPKIGGDQPPRPHMFYALYVLHSAGSKVQFHTYRVHQALLHVISVTSEMEFQAVRTWTEHNLG